MRCSRVWLLAVVSLLAAPASAQISGTPIEASGQAGLFNPDTRARAQAGPAFGGTLGWRFQPWLVAEGYALFAPSKADTAPEPNHSFTSYGLDLRYNLRPGEQRVVPYFLTGFGLGQSDADGHPTDQLQRGAPSLGLGVLVNAFNPRSFLRLQVRDVFFRERDQSEMSNHVAVTLGLHVVLGGKARDSDLDGVRDWLDQCPATPLGATVDARGCPSDADRDSVLDGIDKCANTPAGCKVDRDGCPVDSDGDGVCDGVDACADTPKGARVDVTGCPTDADRDSVWDGIDTCPDTPAGCPVDEKGCPKDLDGDGVCDGLDQCPGTDPGLKVDAKGCPIESAVRETELMDTGRIRLQDVNFETGKADLLPESFASLDAVGEVLSEWPSLRIEIGGHTDARGSDAANRRLSEARAKSVLDYLGRKFPGLKPEQFSVKGYGESRPIAPNTTDIGMAKNRRVDFVVLNRDVLRREVERRRLLRRGEATPAPAPPDTTALPQIAPAPAPTDTTTSP